MLGQEHLAGEGSGKVAGLGCSWAVCPSLSGHRATSHGALCSSRPTAAVPLPPRVLGCHISCLFHMPDPGKVRRAGALGWSLTCFLAPNHGPCVAPSSVSL